VLGWIGFRVTDFTICSKPVKDFRRVVMVELRWRRVEAGSVGLAFTLKGGVVAFTFEDGVEGVAVVLEYRYRLPRHPGFIMKADPVTGLPLDQPEWSEWVSVGEGVLPEPAA
jgi:hypothetical protein